MTRSIRSRRPGVTALAALAAALAGSACGNGGSGEGGGDDDPPPPGDQFAPLALVQFPPDGCLTDAPEARLVIAATDDTGVSLVRARGVAAVRGSDGLWRATVPLQNGNNSIDVATFDTLGNFNLSANRVAIRRESALWIEANGLAFDDQTGQALVLDPALRALFAVGQTGLRSVLSSAGVGSGPPFANPRDVDVAPNRFAAVVTDGQLDAVIMVSLSTGLRTTISGSGIGIGPGFIDLHGIAVDSARDRALVVDDVRSELMAVDLSSGDRTTISSDAVGSGPSLIGPRRIGIDVARNRALVTLGLSRSIVAVDLANGDRTLVSGGAAGSGPAFVAPLDLVVDLFRDRALVADPGASAVFAVDLATGAREVLSGPGVGLGPALIAPAGVALHLGGAPLLVDSSLDALIEFGALSGDRAILSGVTRGTGPQFARPSGIGSGSTASNLVVADRNALYAVARANGARTLLSGSGAGSGAPFLELADVAVASFTSPCITALDAALPGLFDVHPISGNRALISGDGIGSGPDFTRPRALFQFSGAACPDTIFVLEGPLVPAVDFGTVLRVDPATGERTVLADATHGLGPVLVDPVAMDVDPRLAGPTPIASVLDAGLLALVHLDLGTGDRAPGRQLPANVRAPTDLVFGLGGFLVTVADPPMVLAIDEATTVLSDATHGLGPLFGRPEALELVPSATLGALPSTLAAYVVDSARGSVLVVDLETGERLILTK